MLKRSQWSGESDLKESWDYGSNVKPRLCCGLLRLEQNFAEISDPGSGWPWGIGWDKGNSFPCSYIFSHGINKLTEAIIL